MQKTDMQKVSDNIHQLDKDLNKSGTDGAIWNCSSDGGTTYDYNASSKYGKCRKASNTSGKSLKDAFAKAGEADTKDIAAEDAKHISEVMTGTAINGDQKSKISSAFAKAHEGAEIVEIRSISTTSVMVNACYDVLAEGIKQL